MQDIPDRQDTPDNDANRSNDVNLSVLGTGCGTSFGMGCVSIMVVTAIVSIVGVQAVRSGLAIPLLGFCIGTVGHLAIGYVTGRSARSHNVAVNFHVILVGALSMLVGMLAWVFPQGNAFLSPQTLQVVKLLNIVSWLLTIPLMLLGASWSSDDAD